MRTRRIGNSAALLLLAAFSLSTAWSAKKHGEKKTDPYAIVGGTVFRESGFSLPGAEVMIVPDPQSGQTPVKLRNPKAVSDGRGEFAFRVPTSPMRYIVKAQAKGFQTQQKSVDIEGEVRAEVTLTLPAESK